MKVPNISFSNKVVIEFVSISFAVLLALMVNQCKDNYNTSKLAKVSLSNIRSEINNNKEIMQEMVLAHKNSLLKVDSLLPLLTENSKVGEDVNRIISFKLISSNSWETAKLTQSIQYMDINIVQEISAVYKLQDYYELIVKDIVLNNMYKKVEQSDLKTSEKTKQFLKAVIPIEENLLITYNYLLTDLLVEKKETSK
jgi:hypothetical protein